MEFRKVLKKHLKGLLPKVWGGDNSGFLQALLPFLPSIIGGASTIAGMIGGGQQEMPEYPAMDPYEQELKDKYMQALRNILSFQLPTGYSDVLDKLYGQAGEQVGETYRTDIIPQIMEQMNRQGLLQSGITGERLQRGAYEPWGEKMRDISLQRAVAGWQPRMNLYQQAMGQYIPQYRQYLGGERGQRFGYEMGRYGQRMKPWQTLTGLGSQMLGGAFGGGIGGGT